MIHQLMEAYGWSYDEAMSRTTPQIILLGHASHVSHERAMKQSEAKSAGDKKKKAKEEADPIVLGGRRLSELNTDQMMAYYGGFGG